MKRISESSKITLTLGQIVRLVNECRYVFETKKERLIDKASISDNEKAELKDIFDAYPDLESIPMLKNKWNKPSTITGVDVEMIRKLAKAREEEKQRKRREKQEIASDPKNIFKSVGTRLFKYIGENNDWLFVAPLTYEAAVYCDSSENQGGGAKWCIGKRDDRSYWDRYVSDGSAFIMAFNKNYKELSLEKKQTNLKYMIQQDGDHKYHLWIQKDRKIKWNAKKFGEIDEKFDQMFDMAREALDESRKQLAKEANEKVNELLQGLTEIDEYTIPEEYRGLITKIVIPNSVTSIGDYAFGSCLILQSIDIPDSVTSIEEGAFSCCSSLKSIVIPDSVTSIENGTFSGCSSLESLVIPNSVTTIGNYAFSWCTNLKSIVIQDSVTSIGSYAFWYCSSLQSIVIPDSVTSIENGAFSGCSRLKSVVIPNSATSIGEEAFPTRCEVVRKKSR